ncbi:MAG: nuclear transport factor 2 family protein [Actinobacteria bacterium]|nr:nuclear transport factor 2 family protein [Actinomycetota bacterium]
MGTPSREHIVGLESQVWDALVRGDADADRSLLTGDFVGVYPSGFANRDEHASQLDDGPTMTEYTISEARLIEVSPTAVMLCYRADYRHVRDGRHGEPEAMYISSLWVERDGQWLNSFSQDTPTRSR